LQRCYVFLFLLPNSNIKLSLNAEYFSFFPKKKEPIKGHFLATRAKNPSICQKIPLSLSAPKIPRKGTNPSIWQHCSHRHSGLCMRPKHPYMGATPDYLFWCECCGKCVEIKCPYCVKDCQNDAEFKEKLKYLQECIKTGKCTLNKNHAYYYQVQCQIFLSESDYCEFVVWTPTRLFVERIEKDEEFWNANMTKALQYFHLIALPELLGKFWTRKPSDFTVSQDNEVII